MVVDGNEEDIAVERLLDFSSEETRMRRLFSIGCENEWEGTNQCVQIKEGREDTLLSKIYGSNQSFKG